MTPSKTSSSRHSFESLRKQAKQLLREASANNPSAVARIQAQLPTAALPLVLRDAQFVLAREHGFAGWQDLRVALLRHTGDGLEWAAAEAESAIYDNNVERLKELVRDYPSLPSWISDTGESLLGTATGSFGDSGDPYREQMFTRLECAELLLDAGSIANPEIWDGAIRSRAKGILHLLSHKSAIPRKLDILVALGDYDGVEKCLTPAATSPEVMQAFLIACRFERRTIASLILNRCIELDRSLGEKIDKWRGKSGFIDFLIDHPQAYGSPWQASVGPWLTVVMIELTRAIDDDNLEVFTAWLRREPDLLGEPYLAQQVELIEHAVLKDRSAFVIRFMEFGPSLKRVAPRPPSSALEFALDYGKAHLIPLLTTLWPLPDDLAHSAGVGDFSRVKSWFDSDGRPTLGNLGLQYPTNNPSLLRNLRWTSPNAQQVLDVSLAWACVNRQFETATFLLDRGANINTNWSTHEPASILHECAISGNYEAAKFLIDHGIDMTIRDHRWNATAEGWARYAAQDMKMAEFLAAAEKARTGS